MEKEKLRRVRKQKGFTQQQIADIIATDVSNYSRKEGGSVKIIHDEWNKIAKFLEVPLEDIYEEEEATIIINNENNSSGDNSGFYSGLKDINNNYNIPNNVIDSLQNYIAMLEEEIKRLKENQK
ncbi:helix-turn-helix transcriptional regulator [Chryseobacterium fluminis]|uniref:helix-turn-helix transcriptional regulator n=1 Tax=Chryseobacterium fluminis TaxID=2983606 RepID=UPI002259167A|nr:helix-turn-helix transcriptional regulator [Chryseobacterium sp. MMS21-Ot14]UZT96739.1 helix-turn-helix transcriptional regulator [Chryseobacterium sp. MMS21-Ot14]